MDRYMVVIPHTEEDCLRVLKQIEAIGTITHFDWGCKDGDHTGWAIIEADSASEAMLVVPTIQRAKAQTIKLTRFNPEEIRSMHV
ncbi:MAG: hypothetical protein HY961_15095 [Ignavibacteriae bacterium]|nr:hypothetical protein [Ignavibacteriota bacterium]